MSLIFELVQSIGLSSSDIARIINTAPARYRVYSIKKRNGGERQIAQPSRELKAVQRFILEEKLIDFPVHENATAYEQGRSIHANAVFHRHSQMILKLDFKDFFPSIKVRDWMNYLDRNNTYNILPDDFKMYSKILFWGQEKGSIAPRCLSIGAPTSPKISNIIMNDFDIQMTEKADALALRYTRYADDITISGNNSDNIAKMETHARSIIRGMKSPRLQFNDDKRGVFTRGQRRMVTGLIITPQQSVSIGRDRKRKISSMLYHSLRNELSEADRSLLKGLLGFCAANEPQFIERMRRKYDDATVDEAMKFYAPKRKNLKAVPPQQTE